MGVINPSPPQRRLPADDAASGAAPGKRAQSVDRIAHANVMSKSKAPKAMHHPAQSDSSGGTPLESENGTPPKQPPQVVVTHFRFQIKPPVDRPSGHFAGTSMDTPSAGAGAGAAEVAVVFSAAAVAAEAKREHKHHHHEHHHGHKPAAAPISHSGRAESLDRPKGRTRDSSNSFDGPWAEWRQRKDQEAKEHDRKKRAAAVAKLTAPKAGRSLPAGPKGHPSTALPEPTRGSSFASAASPAVGAGGSAYTPPQPPEAKKHGPSEYVYSRPKPAVVHTPAEYVYSATFPPANGLPTPTSKAQMWVKEQQLSLAHPHVAPTEKEKAHPGHHHHKSGHKSDLKVVHRPDSPPLRTTGRSHGTGHRPDDACAPTPAAVHAANQQSAENAAQWCGDSGAAPQAIHFYEKSRTGSLRVAQVDNLAARSLSPTPKGGVTSRSPGGEIRFYEKGQAGVLQEAFVANLNPLLCGAGEPAAEVKASPKSPEAPRGKPKARAPSRSHRDGEAEAAAGDGVRSRHHHHGHGHDHAHDHRGGDKRGAHAYARSEKKKERPRLERGSTELAIKEHLDHRMVAVLAARNLAWEQGKLSSPAARHAATISATLDAIDKLCRGLDLSSQQAAAAAAEREAGSSGGGGVRAQVVKGQAVLLHGVPMDTNGDGQADSLGFDTNGDGRVDTVKKAVHVDTTGDGIADAFGVVLEEADGGLAGWVHAEQVALFLTHVNGPQAVGERCAYAVALVECVEPREANDVSAGRPKKRAAGAFAASSRAAAKDHGFWKALDLPASGELIAFGHALAELFEARGASADAAQAMLNAARTCAEVRRQLDFFNRNFRVKRAGFRTIVKAVVRSRGSTAAMHLDAPKVKMESKAVQALAAARTKKKRIVEALTLQALRSGGREGAARLQAVAAANDSRAASVKSHAIKFGTEFIMSAAAAACAHVEEARVAAARAAAASKGASLAGSDCPPPQTPTTPGHVLASGFFEAGAVAAAEGGGSALPMVSLLLAAMLLGVAASTATARSAAASGQAGGDEGAVAAAAVAGGGEEEEEEKKKKESVAGGASPERMAEEGLGAVAGRVASKGVLCAAQRADDANAALGEAAKAVAKGHRDWGARFAPLVTNASFVDEVVHGFVDPFSADKAVAEFNEDAVDEAAYFNEAAAKVVQSKAVAATATIHRIMAGNTRGSHSHPVLGQAMPASHVPAVMQAKDSDHRRSVRIAETLARKAKGGRKATYVVVQSRVTREVDRVEKERAARAAAHKLLHMVATVGSRFWVAVPAPPEDTCNNTLAGRARWAKTLFQQDLESGLEEWERKALKDDANRAAGVMGVAWAAAGTKSVAAAAALVGLRAGDPAVVVVDPSALVPLSNLEPLEVAAEARAEERADEAAKEEAAAQAARSKGKTSQLTSLAGSESRHSLNLGKGDGDKPQKFGARPSSSAPMLGRATGGGGGGGGGAGGGNSGGRWWGFSGQALPMSVQLTVPAESVPGRSVLAVSLPSPYSVAIARASCAAEGAASGGHAQAHRRTGRATNGHQGDAAAATAQRPSAHDRFRTVTALTVEEVAVSGAASVPKAHARVRRQTAATFFHLGNLYINGVGVAFDLGKAAEALAIAAALGHGQAQNNLAMMHAAGDGVAPNPREAVRLYALAADQGIVSAQYNLGIMLSRGVGSKVDHRAALMRWLVAAASGHVGAHYNVAVCFEKGRGMAKPDLMRAIAHYTVAAEQGHRDAMFNLAFLFEHGSAQGMPETRPLAGHYYLKAAEAGDPEAYDRYEAIRKKAQHSQVKARAQARRFGFFDWGLEKTL